MYVYSKYLLELKDLYSQPDHKLLTFGINITKYVGCGLWLLWEL